MNKIACAVAASAPLLLAACTQKECPEPIVTKDIKPDFVVADVEPITDDEKAKLLATLKARIPKPTKVVPAVASGAEWAQAINENLIVDRNHCRAEDGTNVPDPQCHLYVVEPPAGAIGPSDPVRILRIG